MNEHDDESREMRELLRDMEREQLLELVVLAAALVGGRQRPRVPDKGVPVFGRH